MRQCGDCQLCCKLLPVRELGKPASTRCKHQSHARGCKVYGVGRGMPVSCKVWTCAWLTDPDARDLPRPDRARYVVDVMPDYVTAQDGPCGPSIRVRAVQVWIDPDVPDIHRDPALRAYLQMRGERDGAVAVIRTNSRDAFTLVPPALSGNDRWLEIESGVESEHSVSEIFDLDAVAVVPESGNDGAHTPQPESGAALVPLGEGLNRKE